MKTPLIGRESDLADLTRLAHDGHHLLLIGPAGVGKSRVIEALGRDLQAADGFGLALLTGLPGGDAIPFGAVSHLLDDTPPADRTWLLRSLRSRLDSLATDRGLVLAVEDLDLVDDSTLALIQMVVAEGETTLLATARTEGSSDDSRSLTRGLDFLRPFPIHPLDRSATVELAEATIGGKTSVRLGSTIWRIAKGNPMFISEMITAGQSSGSIVRRNDYYDLDGELSAPRSLWNLVRSRTQGLDSEERLVLHAAALSEPGRVGVISKLAGMGPLVSLEQKRLIEVHGSGENAVIQMSHPLIGEVVRSGLGELERRATVEKLSGVISQSPGQGDALRLITWQFEAGEPIEPSLAVEAARTSFNRFDHALTLRILESIPQRVDAETLTLQGRSLAMDGRPHDAELALQKALTIAETPEDRADAATALAETFLFALSDPERAIKTLEDVMATLEDDDLEVALEAIAQLAAGYAGDFSRTLKNAPALLDLNPSAMAEVPIRMILSLGQSMTGQLDGVLEGIDSAEEVLPEVRATHPLARDQLAMNRVLALHALGRLDDARRYVEEVVASDDFGQRLQATWMYLAALTHLLSGDLGLAAARSQESVALHEVSDPIGTMAMALGVKAVTLAMSGDSEAALAVVADASDHPSSWPVRASIWIQLAEAWIEATEGRLDVAARRAIEIGDMAVDGTHVVWGAYAYHTAVRLGVSQQAATKLNELEGGPLVDLVRRHSAAAASNDPDGLRDISAAMVDVGAIGSAADARAAAALATRDGDRVRDAVAARQLYAACPSYQAPLLAHLPDPLSDRQTEVARHAGAGLTTREIADRLFITPKTVDNHLQAVYRALDLSQREDLAELFL